MVWSSWTWLLVAWIAWGVVVTVGLLWMGTDRGSSWLAAWLARR